MMLIAMEINYRICPGGWFFLSTDAQTRLVAPTKGEELEIKSDPALSSVL